MPVHHDVVLLLTHSEDFYTVDLVAAALQACGVRPLRVNTDDFPEKLLVSTHISDAGGRDEMQVGDVRIGPEQVRAVWTRQLWPARLAPELSAEYRAACEKNAGHGLAGFWGSLSAARWIDPIPRIREAMNKVLQLRLARAAGLTIPRTLVTNAPDEVRAFYEQTGGRMITKLLASATAGMAPSRLSMRTSAVRPEDLNALDGLRHCPMIFQEQIDKSRELRIAYVDGQCFIGAVEQPAALDWRRSDPAETPWRQSELGSKTQARLRALMQNLGLTYGAIDVIQTPDGQDVFLEVNPTGEWGMLERDLRLPISAALADALLAD